MKDTSLESVPLRLEFFLIYFFFLLEFLEERLQGVLVFDKQLDTDKLSNKKQTSS